MSPKMWNIGNYRVYKLEEALDIENQSSIPPSHFLSSVYTLQGLRGMLISPKSWTYSQCIPELGHNLMNCPRNMQLRLEINPGLFTCSGVPVPNWSAFQSLSHVLLFVTPWTAALQASLSFTISQSLLKLMLIESGMPSNHLALCRPLLLQPSIWSGCSLKVVGPDMGQNSKPYHGIMGWALEGEWELLGFHITWLCELRQCIQVPKLIHSSLNPESWIVL